MLKILYIKYTKIVNIPNNDVNIFKEILALHLKQLSYLARE